MPKGRDIIKIWIGVMLWLGLWLRLELTLPNTNFNPFYSDPQNYTCRYMKTASKKMCMSNSKGAVRVGVKVLV